MKIARFLTQICRAAWSLVALLGIPISLAAQPDFTVDHPRVKQVIAVQDLVTRDLMAQPEILGTAVGQDEEGEATLVIFVNAETANHGEVMRALPQELRGVRVKGLLTDKFRAFGKPGASHTATQTPPIQLGTSGGWRNDLANGYCCGGTLGSLIQVNGVQYILSNYHVFESDIVNGGNGIVATTGSSVIQPGLIDVRCSANSAQNVGTLVQCSSLPNNNVDASVAQVVSGMVRSDGAILEIGTLSSQTTGAFAGQRVKKSGRTTGLSRSSVTSLNAIVSVAYENECAGGSAFTKTFTGQVIIANRGSGFLNSGDSGSLMVEDVTTNPRAVGLLFAGSSTLAVANPIGEVLGFISGRLGGTARMVGN